MIYEVDVDDNSTTDFPVFMTVLQRMVNEVDAEDNSAAEERRSRTTH